MQPRAALHITKWRSHSSICFCKNTSLVILTFAGLPESVIFNEIPPYWVRFLAEKLRSSILSSSWQSTSFYLQRTGRLGNHRCCSFRWNLDAPFFAKSANINDMEGFETLPFQPCFSEGLFSRKIMSSFCRKLNTLKLAKWAKIVFWYQFSNSLSIKITDCISLMKLVVDCFFYTCIVFRFYKFRFRFSPRTLYRPKLCGHFFITFYSIQSGILSTLLVSSLPSRSPSTTFIWLGLTGKNNEFVPSNGLFFGRKSKMPKSASGCDNYQYFNSCFSKNADLISSIKRVIDSVFL